LNLEVASWQLPSLAHRVNPGSCSG
jgi:hypothetical protein